MMYRTQGFTAGVFTTPKFVGSGLIYKVLLVFKIFKIQVSNETTKVAAAREKA